jgi:post-segregation antitoxin (ccd killing protein)
MLKAVSTEPVEVDRDLVSRVRAVSNDVTGYVESAVRRALDDEAFSRLLDELEAVAGPVPEEIVTEAERFWRAS